MSKAKAAKKAEKKTAKKAAKAEKKAAKKEKKSVGAARKMKISDMALAMSKGNRRQAEINPFKVAEHPASVTAGMPTMAQDEALNLAGAWAAAAVSANFSEGVAFLGYPYLSELAQRPEYRRIAETLATEMTRKWVEVQSTGDKDKTDRIQRIEKAMKKLKVRKAFRRVVELDSFFGRGHIFLDFGNADDSEELTTPIGNGDDFSEKKVKKGSLKALRAIEPVWTYPTNYNSTDPLKGNWYKPGSWFVQGREIHASRLLTFVGREVPDLLKPAYSFGGLSMSQMAKPYVDNWLRTRQSVADLISSFSVSGVNMDMSSALGVADATDDHLFRRIDLFNNLRDNRGVMLLDKEEKFFNVSTPLSTLDALQAQTQEHMAAVSGIPIVKLLGISPAGLNASSEGEIRAFYDWIHAFQEHLFRDPLEHVLAFIQISEFGEVDPDITFKFVDLWQLDEIQQAQVRRTDAETGNILIANKTISPAEERQRIAADPEAPYASLDVDAVPVEPISEVDKAAIATNVTNAIAAMANESLIGPALALKELKKASPRTGLFSDITDEDIREAEERLPEEMDDLPDMSAGMNKGQSDDLSRASV